MPASSHLLKAVAHIPVRWFTFPLRIRSFRNWTRRRSIPRRFHPASTAEIIPGENVDLTLPNASGCDCKNDCSMLGTGMSSG
jgi:hypothetical protein